jgi:hypothetical protein
MVIIMMVFIEFSFLIYNNGLFAKLTHSVDYLMFSFLICGFVRVSTLCRTIYLLVRYYYIMSYHDSEKNKSPQVYPYIV